MRLISYGMIGAVALFITMAGVSLPAAAAPVATTLDKIKDKVPERFLPGRDPHEAAYTDTVSVLGKSYDLIFLQQTDTPLSWADVASYVPEVIHQKPSVEPSPDQVLRYVNQLMLTAGQNYTLLAHQEFERNKARHMADYPNLPEETVEVIIGEKYHDNSGGVNSQEAQNAHNTYLSLLYLYYALRLEMGKENQDR
jgi:hypothetical protein